MAKIVKVLQRNRIIWICVTILLSLPSLLFLKYNGLGPQRILTITSTTKAEDSGKTGGTSEKNDVDLLDATKQKQLLNYVKATHLTEPSTRDVPYNLKFLKGYREHEDYHRNIMNILRKNGMGRGFFVEAGALDGEYLSYSLELEMQGWNGLLVEASPSLIPQLKAKNRKAWIADVCLAASDMIYVDHLTKAKQNEDWMRGNGRINPAQPGVNASAEKFEPWLHRSEGKVECFKLATLLKAINVPKVDLFVLDIEGLEFKVLESHSFDEIPIKVVTVETWVMPEKFEVLLEFMSVKGYHLEYRSKTDAIFVLK